ncbi:MAG: hemolysin family protein [Erysipelotrichaceae bacterium]|nr:hemolysin family protein [Erysipelotrichaceae bacterium]
MSQSNETLVFVLIILILFSGLFSATEIAYSSSNKIRLKNMDNDDISGASTALKILDDFDNFLTATLIGNNIVNISSASIATVLFTRIYGANGPTISTIVLTIVVLIFGEITPKSIAKKMPERFACKISGFVKFYMLIFIPFIWLFSLWKKLINLLVQIDDEDSDIQDELITMVDEAEKDGDLEEHQSDLISAAIEFNDLDVKDVLTPRVNIVAVNITMSIREIEKVFRLNSFSRLPVYENSIDNIVGVIHEKDFYSSLYEDGDKCTIKKVIKPVIYTSESVKISTLLKQLQKAKLHLAVVTDEYGGTAGIITLEDIIEELVGEIWDEHDIVKEYYNQIGENSFLVKCDADIDDMMERFDVEMDDDEDEFITVSGWLIDQLDGIPVIGQELDYKNLHITVTKADQRKVYEIRVDIKNPDEGKEEDD